MESGSPDRRLVAALLACGIVSSIVYVATDVLASLRWVGYRYADRAVSELLAVGSPTRGFIVPPMTAYNLLILAFAVGVWLVAGESRRLRITSVLLGMYGAVSWSGLVIFPLRPDSGAAQSAAIPLSGVLHALATFVLVILMFAFIGFGASALGRGFRAYSVVTVLLVLAGGVLAGREMARIAAGVRVPWFGILERTNIYSSLLWVAVFAVALMLEMRRRDRAAVETSLRPKKVTAFVGSPHRGGATHTATRMFLDHLESLGGVQTEMVTLADHDIRVCRGCKLCMDRGEESCPLKDDRDVLLAKMDEADALVFAAPNYSFQVAAVMKILLDRIGFLFHRPRFHGKAFTSLVPQGIYGGARIVKYLDFAGGGLGCNVVKGSCVRTLGPMTDEAVRKMDATLAAHARRFHARLLEPAFPRPSLLALMLFRMSRTSIRMMRDGTRDHAYYRGRGWFESDYYYPVHLGVSKKAAGAVFDTMAEAISARGAGP